MFDARWRKGHTLASLKGCYLETCGSRDVEPDQRQENLCTGRPSSEGRAGIQ